MRAVIKHLLSNYWALDDEIIVVEDGIISVYAFDLKLATDVARWVIGHMADRGFEIKVIERFMDFKVSIVPKRRIGN